MVEHFADGLIGQVAGKRSQVVVGLDPRVGRLPSELRPPSGANAESAAGAVLAFNRAVIDAVAGSAIAVKPQIAFYECLGCAGMAAYAETIRHAHAAGLVVIADVKRSDIGSTASAYAAAHLGMPDGTARVPGDFEVDAVTVNPYLGWDGVEPFVAAAAARGHGLFVLVKTSNPSSVDVQDLPCGEGRLHEHVGRLVAEWGAELRGESGYSLVGAVVGAPFPEEMAALRHLMPHSPFLVPGFGAQGAGVDEARPAFGPDGLGAIVNSSRGVIFAWEREPYRTRYGEERWREAVAAAAEDMRQALWQATH